MIIQGGILKNIMGILNSYDQRFIQSEIQGEGNTCTVIEVSLSTGSDEYRTVSETLTSNANIKCMTQILTEEDEDVKEGNFRRGDMIFWFDEDQESIILQGNRITFDSKTFQIKDVEKFDSGDNTFLIRAMTEQI